MIWVTFFKSSFADSFIQFCIMGRKCGNLLASMLYLIGKKYDSKNIGLYRGDRIAVLKNVSRPASEKIKKHLQYLFIQKGLQIIIE